MIAPFILFPYIQEDNPQPKFKIIKYGQKNSRVKLVQQMLNKLGYQCPSNGIYDLQTVNAVTYFQSKNLLIPDGMVGQKTFSKLHQAVQMLDKTMKDSEI